MRINTTQNPRVAGGKGALSATYTKEQLLRRAVVSTLLGENVAYQDGTSVMYDIQHLVAQVHPRYAAQLAQEAADVFQLRSVPLWIIASMATASPKHRAYVAETIQSVVRRPDQLTELLAMYWKQNGGRVPIANQLKKGIAEAFTQFDAYQLAKYARRKNRSVSLRDVMYLTHPKPKNDEQARVWIGVAEQTLRNTATWESQLSAKKRDPASVFLTLMETNRLPALAALRNIRLMRYSGIDEETIAAYLRTIRLDHLPIHQYYLAAIIAQQHKWRIIESTLLDRIVDVIPKVRFAGNTILIQDASGSMTSNLSRYGLLKRMDIATLLSWAIAKRCDSVEHYLTAGIIGAKTQRTMLTPMSNLLNFKNHVYDVSVTLGYNGIFTRQAIEQVRQMTSFRTVDRIIVITDSQDVDTSKQKPEPFGLRNYILDIGGHTLGVGYTDVWSAEVTGFSPHVIYFLYEIDMLLNDSN